MPVFDDVFPGGVARALRSMTSTDTLPDAARFAPFSAEPGAPMLIMHSSGDALALLRARAPDPNLTLCAQALRRSPSRSSGPNARWPRARTSPVSRPSLVLVHLITR